MPSEFHQFVKLPTELRLRIWEYALRPISLTLPGAHFFSVLDSGEDGEIGEIKKEFQVQCDPGPDCEYDHCRHYSLAAPKFGRSHSWTRNNPSAYLWDFGMWNACRESREIMEKHYEMEHWRTKLHQEKPLDHAHRYFGQRVDACVPFIYSRSDGDWCFTIHPKRDLACLQPLNVKNVCYYNYYGWLNASCMLSLHRGLRGFANLAFEYDSSWYDGLDQIKDAHDLFKEMSPRGLFIRTLVSLDDKDWYAPHMLWLIDYSLKRYQDGGDAATSEKGKVFNGIDRKFVQVDLDSRIYSGTGSRSALQFVRDLEALFFDDRPKYTCLYDWDYDSDRSDGGYGGYCIGDQVQVLACEENT